MKWAKFYIIPLTVTLFFLCFHVQRAICVDREDFLKFNIGYLFESGNTDVKSTYLNIDALKFIDKVELSFSGEVNYKLAGGQKVSEYGNGRIGVDYDFNQTISAFIFSNTSYDIFQKVALREEVGVGAKYTFIRTENSKVSLSAAHLYDYKKSTVKLKTEHAQRLSIRLKMDFTLFEDSKFAHVTFYQPAYEDFSNYRITSDTSLSVPMNETLALKVTFKDRYDNKPEANVEKNDISVITSLEITF